ncbi:MAG: hypothetical protein ACK5L5_04165 [Bacteroidales bacterium]
METQVWILTSVVGVFMSIFLILFKSWMTDQKTQQKEIVQSLNDLRETLIKEQAQVKTLFDNNINRREEIRELDNRLTKVEKHQYLCGKCVEWPKED